MIYAAIALGVILLSLAAYRGVCALARWGERRYG
ncbi:hypothetical protein LCGC14_3149370 [marine sediment metagenome]|uniref:Uncharacterized protein n=1 Tax=marine sediment metagenome TaxID=412755 RepID=A0A0F8YIW8_9ZZZZ